MSIVRGTLFRRDCLPALRHHARLCCPPPAAEYISNVGVTLMRMGRAMEAKQAFEKALRIQPGFQNAIDNLNELIPWMKGQGMLPPDYNPMDFLSEPPLGGVTVDLDFDDAVPTPKPVVRHLRSTTTTRADFAYLEHHTEPFPRVAFTDLGSQAMKEFAFGRRPFVITGLKNVSAWATSKALTAWDFQFFQDNFGDKVVDFYPHNMAVETVKPFFASLSAALAEAKHPSGQYRTKYALIEGFSGAVGAGSHRLRSSWGHRCCLFLLWLTLRAPTPKGPCLCCMGSVAASCASVRGCEFDVCCFPCTPQPGPPWHVHPVERQHGG